MLEDEISTDHLSLCCLKMFLIRDSTVSFTVAIHLSLGCWCYIYPKVFLFFEVWTSRHKHQSEDRNANFQTAGSLGLKCVLFSRPSLDEALHLISWEAFSVPSWVIDVKSPAFTENWELTTWTDDWSRNIFSHCIFLTESRKGVTLRCVSLPLSPVSMLRSTKYTAW